ncbi:MAG TPA: retroviral-like aspartic protease family protein [Tenuifilaceae bacterium]|nr:retroviral-like aspartic protease family protein [Tenuifilaceae bacterium]
MKSILTIGLTLTILTELNAQTVVKMEKLNGVYIMPCKVNGLSLKFIFDTGTSDVSISLTEALFMLKNGYLSEDDLIGTEYYRIANGDIEEGTNIVLKTIEIGKLKLYNVKASVVHNLSAPLLLGQTALSKLGKIEFDYANSTLTILGGPSEYVYHNNNRISYSDNSNNYSSKESVYTGNYKFATTFDNPPFEVPIRSEPNVNSREVYKCPKNATVYVIDNSGEIFFKVYVNGYTGYITKGFLKRKW